MEKPCKKEAGLNVHPKIFTLFGDSFLFSYIRPVWDAPRNPAINGGSPIWK